MNLIRGLLGRDDLEVLFFEDGVLLFKRGKKGTKNQEVLDFMKDNESRLRKNLFNPYVLGNPPEDGREREVYSETILIQGNGT